MIDDPDMAVLVGYACGSLITGAFALYRRRHLVTLIAGQMTCIGEQRKALDEQQALVEKQQETIATQGAAIAAWQQRAAQAELARGNVESSFIDFVEDVEIAQGLGTKVTSPLLPGFRRKH